MKSKKIFLAFLLFAVTLVLASCADLFQPAHYHTFDTEWTSDATHHWHGATCEHETESSDKAEHSWDAGEVTVEATIDAAGVKTFKCTVCGASKEEVIEKLPHDHTYADAWSKDDTHHWHAATCVHDTEVSDKAEHSWNAGEVTTEPTEEAVGVKLYTCTVCEATKEEELAKLPHTHKYATEYSSDEDCHWYASACGHEDEVAGYEAHNWNAGEVTTLPTCSANGVKTFTCVDCNRTKTEPVGKDQNAHAYSTEWSKDATNHWHAASCGHNVVKDEAAHEWNDGEVTTQPTYYEEGVKTYTCTVCGQTRTESVPVVKNYSDPNWTSKVEEGYYYLDGKMYSAVEQDLTESAEFPWFNYSAVNYNLYNTEQGAHYTIKVDIKGTVANLKHTTLLAGAVVWYQDANNYIVFGAHWAEKDRPGDIRSFWFKGKVGGKVFSTDDWWCDNSQILPADGISIEITKLFDAFTFVAKSSNGSVIKSGNVTISGTSTPSSYVGVVGLNDKFEFSNFSVVDYVPAPTVYTANIDGVAHVLELSKLDDSFVLKVGSEQQTGTYVVEGYNITLTFADESVKLVTFDKNGGFVYAEEEEEEGVIKVVSGEPYTVARGQTGDYDVTFHVQGTATSVTNEMWFRFVAWYVDENNFADIRVMWSPSCARIEIEKICLYTCINGVHKEEDLLWGDFPNNQTLPADGFTMRVVKNVNAFSYTLTFNNGTVKAKTVRPSNYDNNAEYSVRLSAHNEKYKITELNYIEIAAAKTQTYTNVSDSSMKLELDLNGDGCKLISGGNSQTGTYVSEGGFVYVTIAADVYKVRLIGETFAIVVEENTDNAIVVESGKSVPLVYAMSGDYDITMNVVGTKASAVSSEVKYRFLAWYLDSNNYVEIFVEWQQWDRSFEIRSIQVRSVINGSERNEIWTIWGDNPNNNTLPADGFTLNVKKTGNTFAIKLVTKLTNITKSATVTVPELTDLESVYLIKAYAVGDTFTVTGIDNTIKLEAGKSTYLTLLNLIMK